MNQDRQNLSQHICTFCEKSFATKTTQQTHEKYVHSEERAWCCKLCPNKYKDKNDLQKHENNIHSELVHKCKECLKSFQGTSFKRHLKSHTDNKIFLCTLCIKIIQI